MKIVNNLLAFVFVSLLICACGDRYTAAVLDDIESYIQDSPDSALIRLRSVDTSTLTTSRLKAQYALLHAIALDKNWIDTSDVGVVMPAIHYYDRHPSGVRRAKAWYYLGRIYENGGNLPDASIALLKAERYAEPYNDYFFNSLIYQSISNIYSKTHYHEEALRYTELSYSASLLAGDTLGGNASLYRMAQDYSNLGRYSEADSLYRLFIDNEQIHPKLKASLLSGYALLLVTYHEDYSSAVSVFEDIIATYGSLKGTNYWGAFAYALMRTGDTSKAERLFEQLNNRLSDPSLSYYYWKSLADAYSGRYDAAYYEQKAASCIQEENVNRVLNQSAIKAQKDFLEEIALETEEKARERHLVTMGAIGLLIAVIILLSLCFRYRRKKVIQEREELLEAYKQLTIQQSSLTSHISELKGRVFQIEEEKASVRSRYLQLCQSYFRRIGLINDVLYYHNATGSDDKQYKELKQAIRGIGLDSHNRSEFEDFLNETFDDVMIHFREAFPKRSPRYYQLVSFLFAGFSTATICIIIPEYKKQDIYVHRFRLKKQIHESSTPYKEQFMNLIS